MHAHRHAQGRQGRRARTKQNLAAPRFAGLTVRLTADRLPDRWRSRSDAAATEGTYLLSLADYAEVEGFLAALREEGATIAELSLQKPIWRRSSCSIMARHR